MVENYETKMKEKLSRASVCFLLLLMIIGGVCVIMHDTCYVFGDDVQYMRCTGQGNPFHITRDIGCTPEIGRFFPMAYFTYNILLPFRSLAPLSADWHYGVHALFWCIFLIISFILYRKLFAEKTEKYADIFALLLTLVVAQRTLEFFACLWTTEGLSMTFLTLGVYLLYRYSTTRKIGWLVGSAFAFCYLTFCSEHFFVIPLSIAVASFMSINGKANDKKQGYSFLVAGLLFITIYLLWIVPQITQAYDGAHGDECTRIQNVVRIMLGQKFLFVTLLVFGYRLYAVFIRKKDYDLFGDVLLVGSVVYVIGGFILKLNWPLYYLPSIILSLPACIRCLDFSEKRRGWISGVLVIVTCGYYIIKIPTTSCNMWKNHSGNCIIMKDFNEKLLNEERVAYFPVPTEADGLKAEWTYSGIRDYLRFYKQDKKYDFDNLLDIDPPFTIVTLYSDKYDGYLQSIQQYAIERGLEAMPVDTADRYSLIRILPSKGEK